MDEHDSNPIFTIVKATGLPLEFWPASVQEPSDGTVSYSVSNSFDDVYKNEDPRNCEQILLRSKTISALQSVPAAHIFGQGVLVRTDPISTAMVSIAEAAYVLLGKAHSSLLWLLLEFIERELITHACNKPYQQSWVKQKKEISYAEHTERIRRENLSEIRMGNWEKEEWLKEMRAEIFGMTGGRADVPFKGSKREEALFDSKLNAIQEQNNEVLQLLKTLSPKSHEVANNLPAQLGGIGESLSGAGSSVGKFHRKFYDYNHFRVHFRTLGDNSSVWISTGSGFNPKIAHYVLDWLEVALGGRGFGASTALLSNCTRLEDDHRLFSGKGVPGPENLWEAQGCWRKKIISGNLLGPSLSESTSGWGQITTGAPDSLQAMSRPFSHCKDGLILTVAALWSLFDNAIERVTNCTCTFQTESGDFIQCKSKSGKWYLWHTFSNEQPCDGEHCEKNVRVALTSAEPGERLHTTSPCILGWTALGRTKPDSPLWNTLKVTSDFGKKKLTKYELKGFQTQAHLSIPAVVSPQIGGAVSFAKRCYEISNSIDHASNLATDMAAATVVLIFDERRGFHLVCDGADIIELLCLQYLAAIGRHPSELPPFTHPTALQRLCTWCQSNFVSPTGTYITGDYLVREASKKVSQLVELAKNAARTDSVLLYWLLEDVVRGNVTKALKAPRTEQCSWHELAFEYPPLIFAVGDVDAKLITATESTLKWSNLKSKSSSSSKVVSSFNFKAVKGLTVSDPVPGGLVGGYNDLQRWLLQAQPFYMASLDKTQNYVVFGDEETDSEQTYQVSKCTKPGTIFASCQDCQKKGSGRCLHYIQ